MIPCHFIVCLFIYGGSLLSLQYLQAYLIKMTKDKLIGRFASYALNKMKLRVSSRRLPPSTTEVAVSELAYISCLSFCKINN